MADNYRATTSNNGIADAVPDQIHNMSGESSANTNHDSSEIQTETGEGLRRTPEVLLHCLRMDTHMLRVQYHAMARVHYLATLATLPALLRDTWVQNERNDSGSMTLEELSNFQVPHRPLRDSSIEIWKHSNAVIEPSRRVHEVNMEEMKQACKDDPDLLQRVSIIHEEFEAALERLRFACFWTSREIMFP